MNPRYQYNTMSFFTFLSCRVETNTEIQSDTNMVQAEEGHNRDLVLYNPGRATPTGARSTHETESSPSKRQHTPENSSSMIPFTPSK